MVDKQQDNGPYQWWDKANRPQAVGIAGSPAQECSEVEGNKRTSNADRNRHQTATRLLAGNDELCDCSYNQPNYQNVKEAEHEQTPVFWSCIETYQESVNNQRRKLKRKNNKKRNLKLRKNILKNLF